MTKSEIIKAAAKKAGYTQEVAAAIINAAIDTAEDALVAGENVALHQFGKLEVRQRKGHMAYSCIAGDMVETPTRIYVGFVPSHALRDRLNGEGEGQ